ncbi:MAG: LysR substrate-binding domain-containing protein, partial [Pigmentiphaga sp.]|nr:LysR substrate-binding domain-containing protein [Pigmentiphaga sp.]
RLFGTGLTTSGRVIDDYMKQHGRTLPVCIFAQGLLALLESLHQTDVVATIPKRMAEEISKTFAIKIVPFPGVLPTVRNALYWHEKNHRSPLHHWFRTLVVDVAAELRTPRKESGR